MARRRGRVSTDDGSLHPTVYSRELGSCSCRLVLGIAAVPRPVRADELRKASGLDGASNGACGAPRGLKGVGRGGSVTRVPAACRKEKQQQRPSGHAAGKGHGKTPQEQSPLSLPGKPSQELGQGDTTGRSRRTLWDFFSSSQHQSVSKPMPLPVSNRTSLAAAQGHVPVSSPALAGDGRLSQVAGNVGTHAGKVTPSFCPPLACRRSRVIRLTLRCPIVG
jgi:hypothetical protein